MTTLPTYPQTSRPVPSGPPLLGPFPHPHKPRRSSCYSDPRPLGPITTFDRPPEQPPDRRGLTYTGRYLRHQYRPYHRRRGSHESYPGGPHYSSCSLGPIGTTSPRPSSRSVVRSILSGASPTDRSGSNVWRVVLRQRRSVAESYPYRREVSRSTQTEGHWDGEGSGPETGTPVSTFCRDVPDPWYYLRGRRGTSDRGRTKEEATEGRTETRKTTLYVCPFFGVRRPGPPPHGGLMDTETRTVSGRVSESKDETLHPYLVSRRERPTRTPGTFTAVRTGVP